MSTAFEDLCAGRNVVPAEWTKALSRPIIPEKSLLDMDDEELQEHYNRVEERADNTREDRALIILERAMEGRLERQAVKVFNQNAANGTIYADQVPEMLETLRYDITNTELHYLLRKFEATDDFDMIPEKELSKKQWLWLVGETQKLKQSYERVNAEAFQICYESMIENLRIQREAGLEGTAQWPHIKPTGPAWFMSGGVKPGYEGALKPYVWGLQPEIEDEVKRKMMEEESNGNSGNGNGNGH